MTRALIPDLTSTLRDNHLLRALVGGASVAIVLQVSQVGLGYVLNICLAHWLDQADYGRYGVAMNLTGILATVAGLGFPVVLLRFIPQYLAANEPGKARGIARYASRCTSLAGVVVALLATAGALVASALGWMAWNAVLLYAFALIPLQLGVTIRCEQLRALREIMPAYLPSRVLYPAMTLGAGFFLFRLYGGDRGCLPASTVLLTLLILTTVLLISQEMSLRVLAPCSMRRAPLEQDSGSWRSVAASLWILAIATAVESQIGVILVGSFLGNETAAAYFVAAKTATLVSFVLVAVNVIAAPMIASVYHGGDHRAFQRLATHIAQVIFWPTALVSAVLILFGGEILELFGPQYCDNQRVLTILVAGEMVNAFAGSVSLMLQMTGNQGKMIRVLLVSALLNIVLTCSLTPLWGPYGAAVARLLSMTTWNVWLYILVRVNLGVDPSIAAIRLVMQRHRR